MRDAINNFKIKERTIYELLRHFSFLKGGKIQRVDISKVGMRGVSLKIMDIRKHFV